MTLSEIPKNDKRYKVEKWLKVFIKRQREGRERERERVAQNVRIWSETSKWIKHKNKEKGREREQAITHGIEVYQKNKVASKDRKRK